MVSLTDFFEESESYYLVMDLMRGGDLFDYIGRREKYSELEARRLCRDILNAVRYCHENGVAHCDLKPKNLMMAVSYVMFFQMCGRLIFITLVALIVLTTIYSRTFPI